MLSGTSSAQECPYFTAQKILSELTGIESEGAYRRPSTRDDSDGRDPTSLRTPEKAGSPLTAGDGIDPVASIPCFDASGPVRTTLPIIMRNAEVRATERSTASAQTASQKTTLQIPNQDKSQGTETQHADKPITEGREGRRTR